MVLVLLDQLQIFWQLYLIELLGLLTSLGLLELQHLIYPRLLAGFGILTFFANLNLKEFQVRYLALFCLFPVINSFQWFWMGSLHKNIQLMLEFLKVLFLVLHFSCHILMTFLIVLSVIWLFMLMILLSTKRWIRHLTCLIDFWTLICSTKKTGKLNWFRLTGLTTLMWKRMGLFLRKNNLLRWQG